jgi:replicative DNA helicase
LEPSQRPLGKEQAAHEITIEYFDKAANPNLAYGLTTGISTIDEETRGAQLKELWLLAGATGHGKSVFMINWARHLITSGPYNVILYSLEMRMKQIWSILYCSHSCDPKFGRDPLEYKKIRAGTLTPDETDFYINEIIPDIRNAPGHLEVFNPSGRRTTIDDIGTQCEVANRERPVDMLIIDYIGILASPKGMKNSSKTERVGDNILQAKQLATDFDNGAGLVIVSPHQINRVGLRKVKENNGVYDLEAIASTSEAENTADNLFAIYQDMTLRQKKEAVFSHLKARDSKIIEPFNVYLPAEYRFVGELAQVDESQLSKLLDA